MVKLYDARGEEIALPSLRTEIERGDHYLYSTLARRYPANGLTAAGLTRILRQADDGQPADMQELFDDMEDRDTHFGAQVQKRVMALVSRPLQVVASESGRKAGKAADFCRQLLHRIPELPDVLVQLAKAVVRGYMLAEIVWDFGLGEATIRELRVEDPRAFLPDPRAPRILRRLTERDPINGEPLEPAKWVQHRYTAKSGLPVRAGLGRTCAWYYLFKQYSLKDWLEFAELYGSPPRLGYYTPGMQDEDRRVLERAVREFSHDLAALLPEGARIDFPQLRAGTASVDLYDRLFERCCAEQSKALLGQTLTTEQGVRGARSLGEVHERVELRLVRGDARALASTLRRDILHPAVQLQFGADYPIPDVELDVEDLDELVTRVKTLVDLGLPVGRAYLYQRTGIPMPAADEPTVEGKPGLQAKQQGEPDFVAGKKKVLPEAMCGYL